MAACIRAMKAAIGIPVTAKTRIGIDDQDSYAFFSDFIHALVDAGCDKVIVHARKAWLHGLNPKQNRTIPPLHYDYAYRIKQAVAHIPVVLNGNIITSDEVATHMQHVDGVMIGRLACQNPFGLMPIHQFFYPDVVLKSRTAVLHDYFDYALDQTGQGVRLSILLKPLFTAAHGLPIAKRWKGILLQAQNEKDSRHFDQARRLLEEVEGVDV